MKKHLLVAVLALFSAIGWAQNASPYCETEVLHFGNDPNSAINLTIENIDDFTVKVTIESVTANPVDFLLVTGGSGAAVSGEDFSVPGQISRTLTWVIAPPDVLLNVLWSKDNFPGNWQLDAAPAGFTLPLPLSCNVAPESNFCGDQVLHFGGDPASAINLTIENTGANSMIVSIESVTADPVDLLIVTGGSGAAISDEDTSVPGVISRTLTWAGTPPSDVLLNVLWSKGLFPGNWQLDADPAGFNVPFAAVCPPAPVTPVSDFCEAETLHFGGDPGSVINLTIENIDDFNMKVTIESADADPVDLLIVTGGSGAAISAEDFSVPGQISRTLTWAVAPTDVQLNVLWSKVSFPGNWQLDAAPAGITVPFAANCPSDPPAVISDFCNAETLHFGGDPGSVIFLTIENIDDFNVKVTISSASADPVDFLLVTGGSGATISDQDFSVPGEISRTLSYALPPSDIQLNVLWSKVSFPGNWQLDADPAGITVPFEAICPNAAAVPTMGQWGLFYLALIILMFGIVAIQETQTSLQPSMAGGSVQKPIRFSLRSFPFEWNAYWSALKVTFAIVPLAFMAIYLGWGEIILDDIIGMLIAIPMVAYVIYLIKRF